MKKLEHLQKTLGDMRANLKASETLTESERQFMTQVHDILQELLDGVAVDVQELHHELVKVKNENEALKAWFDDHEIEATLHRIN